MIKHQDSHLDHALTADQLDWIFAQFVDRTAFFIETLELPTELGTVPCGLYGPSMGDDPIREDEVFYAPRGERVYDSRLVRRGARQTNKVTVVAGPHDGYSCVLFTVYGGPAAPREPGDQSVEDVGDMAKTFWSQHALAA